MTDTAAALMASADYCAARWGLLEKALELREEAARLRREDADALRSQGGCA